MVKRGPHEAASKHQRRSAAMQHYVGLDVSVKETSVCIVDKAGKWIREVKVATKPAAILAVLTEEALAIERIGLEAGPLSQWLYGALAEAGLPVICVETRHMKAALSAQINKSDRNDARGIAQMMRVGLYRPVHVKTLASQKRRMLLTSRQLLQAKALDIENDLRAPLLNFALPLQQLEGGRCRLRPGAVPAAIGRDRPDGGHLEMRRRPDARDVVRGGPGPDDPQPQVVVAQGLGHEDCPASWHEARDRRCGATAGGHHASHVGGWHRVSLDQERSYGHMTGAVRSCGE